MMRQSLPAFSYSYVDHSGAVDLIGSDEEQNSKWKPAAKLRSVLFGALLQDELKNGMFGITR